MFFMIFFLFFEHINISLKYIITRVASGAVSKDKKVNTAPSVSTTGQHRTDGAPMHKFMHQFVRACIKSIKNN